MDNEYQKKSRKRTLLGLGAGLLLAIGGYSLCTQPQSEKKSEYETIQDTKPVEEGFEEEENITENNLEEKVDGQSKERENNQRLGWLGTERWQEFVKEYTPSPPPDYGIIIDSVRFDGRCPKNSAGFEDFIYTNNALTEIEQGISNFMEKNYPEAKGILSVSFTMSQTKDVEAWFKNSVFEIYKDGVKMQFYGKSIDENSFKGWSDREEIFNLFSKDSKIPTESDLAKGIVLLALSAGALEAYVYPMEKWNPNCKANLKVSLYKKE